jgi:hypothetical protein
MHKSVYARFAAEQVIQYDFTTPYRPVNMKNHTDFAHYYQRTAIYSPQATADYIEAKWERQKARRLIP